MEHISRFGNREKREYNAPSFILAQIICQHELL